MSWQPPPAATKHRREMEFESFLQRHEADFARISRASRREWAVEDVRNEAFVLACDIGTRRGHPLDLADPGEATLLLRHLYNHCVRYGERVVRHARRLDHAAPGDDDGGHHWLLDQLAADGGADALSLLEAAEDAKQGHQAPDPYQSPAAGFAWLLRRFDQRMADVAGFLLISLSWCYRCCRDARTRAGAQWSLPHLTAATPEDAVRPWRRFRLPPRQPHADAQMELDLQHRPAQPMRGQLRLL